MKKTNTSQLNFVDFIELKTSRALSSKEIKKHNFKAKELYDLSISIDDYFKTFQVPEKKVHELRPFIPENEDIGFEFVHDQYAEGDNMLSLIKKYLLFCNSIVISDPLIYLLDYIKLDYNSEHANLRIRNINELLIKYSELSDLIKNNIVIPVLSPTIYHSDVPCFDDDVKEKIEAAKPNSSGICSEIRKLMYINGKFKNNVDFTFPNVEWVEIYTEIIKALENKYSRNDIYEPFKVANISQIPSLNPEKININDIINIRKNESLYNDYRAFINNTFKDLYNNKHLYNDFGGEYMQTIQDEFRLWEGKLNGYAKKHNLIESSSKILIGMLAGGITGSAIHGFEGIIPGALCGGVKHTLDLTKDIAENIHNQQLRVSLRNHYLALSIKNN